MRLPSDAGSTSAELPLPPATGPAADRDDPTESWSPAPPPPPDAAISGDTPATPPADPAPAPAPDDAVVGLRGAYERHLSQSVASLKAMRRARQNDPDFPDPVDQRGAELLYRLGDLKKWARNELDLAVPGRRLAQYGTPWGGEEASERAGSPGCRCV